MLKAALWLKGRLSTVVLASDPGADAGSVAGNGEFHEASTGDHDTSEPQPPCFTRFSRAGSATIAGEVAWPPHTPVIKPIHSQPKGFAHVLISDYPGSSARERTHVAHVLEHLFKNTFDKEQC